MAGLEPAADGFEGRRSTIELHPHGCYSQSKPIMYIKKNRVM